MRWPARSFQARKARSPAETMAIPAGRTVGSRKGVKVKVGPTDQAQYFASVRKMAPVKCMT